MLGLVVFLLLLFPYSLGFHSLLSRSRLAPRVYAGKPVEVTFEPAGKTIIAEQGELIEAVAKKAGVTIPFKCKQGRCNSCELRLNGRVSAKACQGAAVPGGPTKKLSVVVVNKKPL